VCVVVTQCNPSKRFLTPGPAQRTDRQTDIQFDRALSQTVRLHCVDAPKCYTDLLLSDIIKHEREDTCMESEHRAKTISLTACCPKQ